MLSQSVHEVPSDPGAMLGLALIHRAQSVAWLAVEALMRRDPCSSLAAIPLRLFAQVPRPVVASFMKSADSNIGEPDNWTGVLADHIRGVRVSIVCRPRASRLD